MTDVCQPTPPLAIAIAGVAGSGKSTLGRVVARSLGLPLVDLDTVTNPLLDRLSGAVFEGHWLSSAHREVVRRGRYEALLAVAGDLLATAGGAVLVAPFTAELRGGAPWRRLVAAVAPAPIELVYLSAPPELLAARRARRGEERDRHRVGPDEARQPAMPALVLDAALSTEEQCAQVRALIEARHRYPEGDG